jgi:hypothetical protein
VSGGKGLIYGDFEILEKESSVEISEKYRFVGISPSEKF